MLALARRPGQLLVEEVLGRLCRNSTANLASAGNEPLGLARVAVTRL